MVSVAGIRSSDLTKLLELARNNPAEDIAVLAGKAGLPANVVNKFVGVSGGAFEKWASSFGGDRGLPRFSSLGKLSPASLAKVGKELSVTTAGRPLGGMKALGNRGVASAFGAADKLDGAFKTKRFGDATLGIAGHIENAMPRVTSLATKSQGLLKNGYTSAGSKVASFAKDGTGLLKTLPGGAKAVGILGKIAGPLGGVLKGVGAISRMIPGLNIVFAVADGIGAVKTLMNPLASAGEKAAALGKAALSVGAALPIPGASLLGGARAAWGVGELASGVLAPKPQPA